MRELWPANAPQLAPLEEAPKSERRPIQLRPNTRLARPLCGWRPCTQLNRVQFISELIEWSDEPEVGVFRRSPPALDRCRQAGPRLEARGLYARVSLAFGGGVLKLVGSWARQCQGASGSNQFFGQPVERRFCI